MSLHQGKSVYVVAAKGGPTKIGIAYHPQSRISGLKTSSWAELSLEYSREYEAGVALMIERRVHELLHPLRLSGEWFKVSVEKAKQAIEQATTEFFNPPPRAMTTTRPLAPTPISISRSSRLTRDQVGLKLREACDGNQSAWAKAHGLSATYVSDVVNGNRPPSTAILKALGLRKTTEYRPIGTGRIEARRA